MSNRARLLRISAGGRIQRQAAFARAASARPRPGAFNSVARHADARCSSIAGACASASRGARARACPLAQASRIPMHFPVMWSQHQLRQCVSSMFSADWLSNFAFPSLGDLVNQSPFVDFARWLDERNIAGLIGSTAGHGTSAMLDAAAGRQAGVHSAKRALPPLLEHSRDEEEHFRAAVAFAKGWSCRSMRTLPLPMT